MSTTPTPTTATTTDGRMRSARTSRRRPGRSGEAVGEQSAQRAGVDAGTEHQLDPAEPAELQLELGVPVERAGGLDGGAKELAPGVSVVVCRHLYASRRCSRRTTGRPSG